LKNHAKLVHFLKNKLTDPDFISTYRMNPNDFTRTRNFTFKSLCLFIISSLQSSIQRELDRFFQGYNNQLLPEKFVGQSAFSQARLKIKPEAFAQLCNDSVEHFYSNYNIKKWRGFRLIAIDGSEVILPKSKETIAKFGEYTTNLMNKSIVLARVSKAYDVLNKINLDAKLVNRKVGEHELANQHLKHCTIGDLVLLDRGYPSFDLFAKILVSGSHFCARLAVSNWNVAKNLVDSGQKEIFAEIKPGKELKRKYRKEGIVVKPIKCRFVCIDLPSGEKEVLITSLLDTINYPHSLFKELYHLRWDIEESYKKDKHRLQLENFSGKTITAIYQDFYATILLGNLTSIFSTSLEDDIDERTQKANYKYQLNFTTAFAKVKGTIALLFTRINIREILDKMLQMFLSNILPVRPGRSFERNMQKRKRYHKAYLPL
jgi:hypothetical protein